VPSESPTIIEVTHEQLQELLDRIERGALREEHLELMRHVLESYVQLYELLGDKNTTIGRLQKMLFGASTEKTEKIVGDEASSPKSPADDGDEPRQEDSDPEDTTDNDEERSPGHGRHSADDYTGAQQGHVPHPTLCPGDACPECQEGVLYQQRPKVLVRFVGQAPIQATVYRMQRLRCHMCGTVFAASAPEEAGEAKYDHSVASMIGLLKFGSGFPYNRLQGLQAKCEIPLAASTQWDIVSAAACSLVPAFEELIRQAAHGEVIHNDDTTAKILEFMGDRYAKTPPPDDPHDPDRTGLFTTGIVAVCAAVRVALFFTGRQHAGENLSDVLGRRAKELDAPIQMCDGLSRNLPKQLKTILANCIAHARRKVVDIYDRFTDECRYVLKAFKVIYGNDKKTREQGMSAEERLAYHQAHSQSTMDNLKVWLDRQQDEKRVEPNSALGEAIQYILNRWGPLTLFLRKAGAPLDNNICEQALKKSILHRKNSMFFRSRRGARVADIYMSLIHTCELNSVNPFDYLNQLQLHANEVADNPDRWMPWNYQDTLSPASLTIDSEAA
jgi:transposase